MNIDLHSPFFPLDALQSPDKYENRAPKLVLNNGRLTSRHGLDFARGFLPERTIRQKGSRRSMRCRSICKRSRRPRSCFCTGNSRGWRPTFRASRTKPFKELCKSRFVGLGNVPLQSVQDAIAIAQKAKSLGVLGLEIGNAVGDRPLDDPSFAPFFEAVQKLDMLLFVHSLEGGLDADDPLAPVLGNFLQFTFRTTMIVERMILKGMFDKYPNLRLCLSHCGGLLAFTVHANGEEEISH